MFWPLQQDVIGDDERDLLISFIRSTKRYTQHDKVREFEAAYSRWLGCKHSVFLNSGSSANLLLIQACAEKYNWRAGDEIVVPALTWPTTVTPVIQAGFRPVFVDANLTDLALDYGQLERKIGERTKAVFLVHILGFPADVDRVQAIIGGRDIVLLEDTCETQGGRIGAARTGTFGDGSSFSFYWGHHMTTIEGGMACTDDDELYRLLVLKRSHGLARELPESYQEGLREAHPDIDFSFLFLTDGYNFRNTEFAAVLGLSQLAKIDRFIEVRNRNFGRFDEICSEFDRHLLRITCPGMSSFVLPFILRERVARKPLQSFLRSNGIESRPLISGNLLRQPFLRRYYVEGEFDNADFLHHNAFYIGNNQFVDDVRLDKLQDLLRKFFRTGF